MKYISLLPSTIITDGIKRSCFIDIEKSLYCTVPLSLSSLFHETKDFYYEDIYNTLDDDDKITFDEYITFLESNNFIISSNEKLNFVHFDETIYEIPFSIQNAIIDSDSEKGLFEKLDFFNEKPESIQLRLFFVVDFNFLSEIIDYLFENDFLNVEIIFNYNINIDIDSYRNLFYRYNIISRFVIMNFNENKTIEKHKIIALEEKLIDQDQCGKISEKLFMPNIKTVAISRSCNSCLYKKIAIDKNGNVKNCPSMSESFGNINETSLHAVLNNFLFKKYWNISKDHINVCKDCEFRHICTDCRAYIVDPEDQYSKPLKCGYNPYTNVWEEWSNNSLNSNKS